MAQSPTIPTTSIVYPWLERLEIKSGSLRNSLFLDLSAQDRASMQELVDSSQADSIIRSPADKYWLKWFKEENIPNSHTPYRDARNPIIGTFYNSKANLFQVTDSSFQLFVNPVLGLEYLKGNQSGDKLMRNTRGIELRGMIDNRIGFYTYATDNQVDYPQYILNYVSLNNTLPGEGYIKQSNTSRFDFFNARGSIFFRATKHVHIQFGNDKNFLGSGHRSLLLSDFAKDYLFLRINTKIWRFNYQNLFTQFTDNIPGIKTPYPKKYGAFHSLSLDILKKWNIGLFEGIIFNDEKNEGRGYDISYLNPVIFYRSVEQNLGSPDNAMVGANTYFLIGKSVKVYGQFLLDEFKISEIRKDRGWLNNKYAYQAGIKYVDIFGLPNIDLQIEYNRIRPYTYASDSSGKNFTQYRQSLAHPLGSNLDEIYANLRINPYGPVDINIRGSYTRQGVDSSTVAYSGSDFGSNPNINYRARNATHEFGNYFLQGVLQKTVYIQTKLSYQLAHNLFIDLNYIYRSQKSEIRTFNSSYIGGGIRLNFIQQHYDF